MKNNQQEIYDEWYQDQIAKYGIYGVNHAD